MLANIVWIIQNISTDGSRQQVESNENRVSENRTADFSGSEKQVGYNTYSFNNPWKNMFIGGVWAELRNRCWRNSETGEDGLTPRSNKSFLAWAIVPGHIFWFKSR